MPDGEPRQLIDRSFASLRPIPAGMPAHLIAHHDCEVSPSNCRRIVVEQSENLEALAFFETVGAGWDFPDRYSRAIDAVTVEDVARAAEQYLTRPTIVVLQPTAR